MDALGMTFMSAVTTAFSIFAINQLDKQISLRTDELNRERGIKLERANAYVYLCWTIAAAWLILLSNNAASSFIYFQF